VKYVIGGVTRLLLHNELPGLEEYYSVSARKSLESSVNKRLRAPCSG